MEQGTSNAADRGAPIAIICHQANKVWCEQNGDASQKDWHNAEQWTAESVLSNNTSHYEEVLAVCWDDAIITPYEAVESMKSYARESLYALRDHIASLPSGSCIATVNVEQFIK